MIPEISMANEYTNEIAGSYNVGGGIKFTHDNVNPGEIKISSGALGFLGGCVSYGINLDPRLVLVDSNQLIMLESLYNRFTKKADKHRCIT
jgi:hypothetical protein